MKGDPLPSRDHVLRHCNSCEYFHEPDGLPPYRAHPDAFVDDSPDGLSVTWLEYFEGSPEQQLAQARSAIGRGRKLRKSHRLAKLKVAAVLSIGDFLSLEISVVHDPIELPAEKKNLGHSLIKGMPSDQDNLRNYLANAVLSLEIAAP